MTAAQSIRFPDGFSPSEMTKRGWWLVVLNLFVPGSAQLVAGNRRLGRFGLSATLVLWLVVVILAILSGTAHTALYSVATNSTALTIAEIAFIFYAVLWVVLTLDTIRLIRLVRTLPNVRIAMTFVTVAALVVVAGVAGYGVTLTTSARGLITHVFTGSHVQAPINGRYNIMLLGMDAGPGRIDTRPDSISVASIDAKTGALTLIGIPRNMQRAPIVAGSPLLGAYPNGYDCGVNCLISYLYTYGQAHPELYPNAVAQGSEPGIEAMRDVLEGTLGIKIQYFTTIDMGDFSNLIDALGGITIDSTGRYAEGGTTDARGEPIDVTGWIEPGVQHMDGATALWYSRSRHGTSDYDRMQRQRQVQTAILQQINPSTVLTKFQAVARAGGQIVKTDIPSSMLGYFVDLASKARKHPVATLDVAPPLVQMINPDFVKVRQLVATALATPTATATSTPKP